MHTQPNFPDRLRLLAQRHTEEKRESTAMDLNLAADLLDFSSSILQVAAADKAFGKANPATARLARKISNRIETW